MRVLHDMMSLKDQDALRLVRALQEGVTEGGDGRPERGQHAEGAGELEATIEDGLVQALVGRRSTWRRR